MTMRRRDAIKTFGALAGAASAPRVLSGCGDNAAPGAAPGIDTYVFLMMENRSYDHYLGSRAFEGLPGDGLTAGMSNPDPRGGLVDVFPTDSAVSSMCVVADPPHGWDGSRTQFNAGANDGFVRAQLDKHPGGTGREPMSYMLREHIPVTHALADAYTVCDRWFTSILTGTLPNRMYWHAGTANGAMDNDEVLDGAFNGVRSVHHMLDDVGVDWAYYYGDVPVLGFVRDLPDDGRLRRFNYEFIDDAAAGRLPPVVYIDPAFSANDDHPPHHPLLGQQFIAATYQALATSPQWERCMLVITYDENGGFYDHVPPGTAPDDGAAQGFDQLGFRVPSLVIGPYARQGYVSSVPYDHTSALKHLHGVFNYGELNTRIAAANDLSDTIDTERLAAGDPAPPIQLPAVEFDSSSLPASCTSSSLRELPQQDHDILDWADRVDLGHLDRRRHVADHVYDIADYLDKHNLGRIRR